MAGIPKEAKDVNDGNNNFSYCVFGIENEIENKYEVKDKEKGKYNLNRERDYVIKAETHELNNKLNENENQK